MSQTNAIILRIKADRAKEFERLFKKHQYPNWVKHHKRGGMIAASLTRVAYGVEEADAKQGGYLNYIVFAKLTNQRTHDAHDNDPDFKAWDDMAEQFQIEGPSVWGGRTIFEIG